jgi:hypothetical protein
MTYIFKLRCVYIKGVAEQIITTLFHLLGTKVPVQLEPKAKHISYLGSVPRRKEPICLTQLCDIAYSSFFVHKMSRIERDEA